MEMKVQLHGTSAVPYAGLTMEPLPGSHWDPVEYHPSRESKLLLASTREAPCGFLYYSAVAENSNHKRMPPASLSATVSQNTHSCLTQPHFTEVITRVRGTVTH